MGLPFIILAIMTVLLGRSNLSGPRIERGLSREKYFNAELQVKLKSAFIEHGVLTLNPSRLSHHAADEGIPNFSLRAEGYLDAILGWVQPYISRVR